MMNLEKMKQKKSKNSVKKGLLAATTILCLTSPMLQTQSVLAAENTAPAITIEKPDGWRQGETAVAITVDASHMPEGFSITKIEAKAGKDGSWQDVTENGSISITGNQTVYVRVTDGEGKVYEQNRSIKCYDTEKPTLSASLTDGVLTIQGNDTVSGITSVTVNGTTYTDLKDGMLRVQLTQKDFTTKQIEITVTDGAGNTSEKYVLQNPYYEWAKKQAEKQKSSEKEPGYLVPVGVSARHIHLTQEHVEALFGPGYQLTKKKELMGGQFASNETVTIVGLKLRAIENVRILGPVRSKSQVEVSATDAIKLGVKAPIRESGNVAGSAPIAVVGPKGAIYLNEGCIIAKRHIHMPPKDAMAAGVHDGDVVSVQAENERGTVFNHVQIRVDDSFTLEMHIDTDEANAAKIATGQTVRIIK
jgi:propanediol utilization protein